MATIYGMSGCTAEILQQLHQIGFRDAQSFQDVENIHQKYSRDPVTVREAECQRLRDEISRLRNLAARLKTRLNQKLAECEATLLMERECLPAKIYALSERIGNPFVRIWHWFIRARFQRRLHVLTSNLSHEVAKPFRKKRRAITRIEGETASLERHFAKIVAKRFETGMCAERYLATNRQLYIGAIGEESVIRELRKLPAPFVVFNNKRYSLYRSFYWRQGGEYVRSSQVDHIVVGPSGIFLIETKNWSRSRTTSEGGFTPEHQIERANFIFYIIASNHFFYKLPIRNLVVMVQGCPTTQSQFVTRLPLSALVSHLLHVPRCLADEEIRQITKWLLKY